MSGRVVNLRSARKRKARDAARDAASANAARHGLSKAERAAEEAERARAERHLDGHRTDDER